ncbi:MAG: hypothetical protein FWH03_08405 [Firmicutes bacterium]|nr:hypothetical protein [Bacillota bacterium]
MRAESANVSKSEKLLLSLSGLSSAPLCLFLFLFFALLSSAAVPLAARIAVPSASLLLAAVLLPLLYGSINASTSVSTGKYHIPLAVSALLFVSSAALCFTPLSSQIAATVLFCITFPVCILSALTFSFALAHIRSTLIQNSDKRFWFLSKMVQLAGAAAFGLFIFLSFHFGFFSLANCAYAAAALFLIGAVAAYFGSAAHMPRFIRLKLAAKTSARHKYKRMYAPFFVRQTAPFSVGYFLAAAALAAFAPSVFAQLEGAYAAAAIGAFVLSLVLTALLAEKIILNRKSFPIILAAALFTLAGTGLAVSAFALDGISAIASALVSCVLAGAGAGIFTAVKNYNIEDLAVNSDIKSGAAVHFYNFLFVCAFCAVSAMFFLSAEYLLYIAAALPVASVIAFAFAKKRQSELAMDTIDLFEEGEIIRDIEIDELVEAEQIGKKGEVEE